MQLVDGKEIRSLGLNIKIGTFAEGIGREMPHMPKVVSLDSPSAGENSHCCQRNFQMKRQL